MIYLLGDSGEGDGRAAYDRQESIGKLNYAETGPSREITRAEIAAARDNSNVLAVLYFDTAAYLPLPVDARSTLCASPERWAATQSDLPVKIKFESEFTVAV